MMDIIPRWRIKGNLLALAYCRHQIMNHQFQCFYFFYNKITINDYDAYLGKVTSLVLLPYINKIIK